MSSTSQREFRADYGSPRTRHSPPRRDRNERDKHHDRDRTRDHSRSRSRSRSPGRYSRRNDRRYDEREEDDRSARRREARDSPARRQHYSSSSQEPRERYSNGHDGSHRPADSHRRERNVPKSFLDKAQESSQSRVEYSWGKEGDSPSSEDEAPKEPQFKPNFGLSGALAKDERHGNAVNGVVLKFTEPAEAALPDKDWRLYVYKGEDLLEKLHIHRRSCFLLGRDNRVCDIPLQHPSVSTQHAVIQFRSIERTVVRDGDRIEVKTIKPYLMDLDSTNHTFLNGSQVEGARYYELRPGDLIKFATSTRDYIILHGDSATNQASDSP